MDFLTCASKPVSSTYHHNVSHSLLPGLNLQKTPCEKHFDGHNDSFPFKCTYKQLFQSHCIPKIVQEGRDPVSELIIAKAQWKTKSEQLVARFRKSAEARVKFEAFRGRVLCGVDEVVVPRNDQRLLKHFKNDPDPCFNGVYNWYYCGGSLCTAIYKDKGYTISAQGRYLDELCIVPLFKENGSLETSSSVIKMKCNKKQPIYQIKSVTIAGKVAVGVRQRDAIHLYLNKNNTNSLILKKEIKLLADNRKPFTGLDLNPSSLGQLCSSSYDREIKLWDLNQQSYVLTGEVAPNSVCPADKKRNNGWCGVTYRSEFEIFVIDKCCFTWLDTRCDLKNPVKGFCLKAEGKKFLDLSCEEISCLVHTKQRNIYIGSTHSVMQYEPRNSFSVPVRSWNHQLSSPPFLAQASNLENRKELLCIGDHKQIVCIISGKLCCSSYPPLSLHPVSKSQGIMGLTELPEYFKDETKFLVQTTAGHIHQQIFKSGTEGVMNNESPPNEVFCKNKLYASSLENMKPIYQYLKKNIKSPEIIEEERPKLITQKWETSKAELESYVDLLSPVILQAWEIEDMEEWSRDENSLQSQSAVNKVEQWLKNADFTSISHSVANSTQANMNNESCSPNQNLSKQLPQEMSNQNLSKILSQEMSNQNLSKNLSQKMSNQNLSKNLSQEMYDQNLSKYLSQEMYNESLSKKLSQDMFDSQESQGSMEYNINSKRTHKGSMGSLESHNKRIKLSSQDGLYESYKLTQSTQEIDDKFCYWNQDYTLDPAVNGKSEKVALNKVTKKRKTVHVSGF